MYLRYPDQFHALRRQQHREDARGPGEAEVEVPYRSQLETLRERQKDDRETVGAGRP